MPRISNSTFKVNDELQQQMEISAIAEGLSIPITVTDALSVTSNIVGVDDSAKTNLSTTASALQTGVYGWDGSNWRQVNVSNGGNVKVESELEPHAGSQGNLANADAYTNGSNSVAIDVSNKTLLTLFGNLSDTSNGVQPQISADGITYYDLDYEVYPKFDTGDFFQNIDNTAVNHFRLKYIGAGTATATLLTNNH